MTILIPCHCFDAFCCGPKSPHSSLQSCLLPRAQPASCSLPLWSSANKLQVSSKCFCFPTNGNFMDCCEFFRSFRPRGNASPAKCSAGRSSTALWVRSSPQGKPSFRAVQDCFRVKKKLFKSNNRFGFPLPPFPAEAQHCLALRRQERTSQCNSDTALTLSTKK